LSKDLDRRALPAIALTTDTSFLTAFGNDRGFEGVFERQVEALGHAGDVLIGISTSGNSVNVVQAIGAAGKRNIRTIALTGHAGRLAPLADVAIAAESRDSHYIQETHLAFDDSSCVLVVSALFRDQGVLTAKLDSAGDDSS